jgi:probable rRNA maturation factor
VSNTPVVHPRQRSRPVDRRLFQQIAAALVRDSLRREEFALHIHLVAAPEMTRLNEQFLRHQGSTDVLAFDYAEPGQGRPRGEVFICIDEAVAQATRFRTTWPSELVRYLVHGVLHLIGYDDHRASDRRLMKREENRLLRDLARRFDVAALAKTRARRRKTRSAVRKLAKAG